MGKRKYLSDKEMNIIRGKAIVGKASVKELMSVFTHLDELEAQLTAFDMDDFFGTEGWRYQFGIPGAD